MKSNPEFLRNIYRRGPFEGHGFICTPHGTGIVEHPLYDFTISDRPVGDWVPWVVENYRRQVDMHAAVGDDAVPCARLATGTHIYAAAFGCPVHRFTDNNPCALPRVQSAAEADRLAVPDLWSSPSLARIFDLAHAVQRELGKDACLGCPDMQSGFDTAALVWEKSSFLCAMADPDEAGAVRRLTAKCAELFKAFLLAFRREFPNCSPCHCPNVWAPPEMGPWLSNDECGAFGTAAFETFCLPELVDLATTFGGLGMHCCADAEHQFASFRKIPGWYAFNRVQARRGYLPILESLSGPDAPVHVLAWIDAAGIERLIREAPAGTRFIFNLAGCTVEEAKSWLARMRVLSEALLPDVPPRNLDARAEAAVE
jgi:hypothetical protein